MEAEFSSEMIVSFSKHMGFRGDHSEREPESWLNKHGRHTPHVSIVHLLWHLPNLFLFLSFSHSLALPTICFMEIVANLFFNPEI